MAAADPIASRYLDSDGPAKGPSWDSEDSPRKAGEVREILAANVVRPGSVEPVAFLAQLERANQLVSTTAR